MPVDIFHLMVKLFFFFLMKDTKEYGRKWVISMQRNVYGDTKFGEFHWWHKKSFIQKYVNGRNVYSTCSAYHASSSKISFAFVRQ